MLSHEKNPFNDPRNEVESDTESISDEEPKKSILKTPPTEAQPKEMHSLSNKNTTINEIMEDFDHKPGHLPPRTKTRTKSWPTTLNSHGHIELSLKTLRASKLPSLSFQQRRHKASHLADLVQANYHASPKEPTTDQQDALNIFTSAQGKGGRLSPQNIIETLRTAFWVFDQYFFFGSLGILADEKVMKIELEDSVKNTFSGQCIQLIPFHTQFQSGHHCTIAIKIQKSNTEDLHMRMMFYLQTLLHQMVHAFLSVYSCFFWTCKYKETNEGYRRHGDAWQDIAQVVERGARKVFGLDLDLGREWACVFEAACRSLKKWDPCPERAEDWGFDKELITKQVTAVLRSENIDSGRAYTCSLSDVSFGNDRKSGKLGDKKGEVDEEEHRDR